MLLHTHSGGVGVTGVLISIMVGIEQGLSTGGIDVMGLVNKMRSQRMNMIQTEVHILLFIILLLLLIGAVPVCTLCLA